MLKRTLVVVIVAIAMSACVSSGKIIALEGGGWEIDCSGGYHDWSGCHSRAKRLCGKGGFDIVSQITNEGGGNVGSNDWSAAGSIITRTMVVRCL
ncbi:MAG: hypothetical protein O7G86_04840 [Gammaproteobacteria bacterium]|nr:hypothetical protein [Gammaproteobacteria bacterium]